MTVNSIAEQTAKPRLAVVGIVGLPSSYGGWETLASNILPSLVGQFDVTVYCSAKRYQEQPSTFEGAHLEYINFDANGIQSIPYDIVGLWRSRKYDAVLILGVSGCSALPFFRLFGKSKYIVNIDGIEWKRDKWGLAARLILRLSEWLGVRGSHAVIADNQVIKDYIRDTYRREATMIAYGGDWTFTEQEIANSVKDQHQPPEGKYAFTVCRIEPENNIHVILEAFSETAYPLIMFGNWQSSKYGQQQYEKYSGYPNITLKDPLYDRMALDQYRANCHLYVHGHSAGGTNPSLVEAMWLGRTIACFDVNFNRATTEDAAFYFADKEHLKTAIAQSMDGDAENGQAMKEIADRRYTWDRIATDYTQIVQDAL